MPDTTNDSEIKIPVHRGMSYDAIHHEWERKGYRWVRSYDDPLTGLHTIVFRKER